MATYMVNVNGVYVKTTVTDRASFVDSFITELVLSCNYSNSGPPIIGLDVECNGSDDLTNHKAATLQLCSGTRCIIIQLISMEVMPQSLINFLSAPLFRFVGVGIQAGLCLLRRDYGVECRNVIDFRSIIELGILTGDIEVEPKPLSVIMGNWGAGNISMEQIVSAASDAHNFYKIGKALLG